MIARIELEVPFHDVDSLGVVWHGHYFKYLEIARTRLFRDLGIDRAYIEARGWGFLVTESRCRHVFPLRYGDRATVSVWALDLDHRVHLAYEVRNETHDRRAARARTVLVTIDRTGAMLLRTPDELADKLRPACAPDA